MKVIAIVKGRDWQLETIAPTVDDAFEYMIPKIMEFVKENPDHIIYVTQNSLDLDSWSNDEEAMEYRFLEYTDMNSYPSCITDEILPRLKEFIDRNGWLAK